MARCSGVASRSSTMARTAPSASAHDPAQPGRVGDLGGEHGERRRRRAGAPRPARRRVSARSSGASPLTSSTGPSRSGTAASADGRGVARSRAAPPGRRARAPGAISARCSSTASRPAPTTTTVCAAPSGSAAASTWPSIERPPTRCSTFGVAERMRVPWPAARTTTAATAVALAGTDSWCGLTASPGRDGAGRCWGTRTRTETARLQRPAGCRLPHPPPAAGPCAAAAGMDAGARGERRPAERLAAAPDRGRRSTLAASRLPTVP